MRPTVLDQFHHAVDRLCRDHWWRVVDRTAFDTAAPDEGPGLICVPADVPGYFSTDGEVARDLVINWRNGSVSQIQAVFARHGLVAHVPGFEYDLDDPQSRRGTATFRPDSPASDLVRIGQAFDVLAGHGYFAELNFQPTSSGCWEDCPADRADRAIFWNSQAHEDCFDGDGNLVDDLPILWAGDRELIAKVLADTGLYVEVPEVAELVFYLSPDGADFDDEDLDEIQV